MSELNAREYDKVKLNTEELEFIFSTFQYYYGMPKRFRSSLTSMARHLNNQIGCNKSIRTYQRKYEDLIKERFFK